MKFSKLDIFGGLQSLDSQGDRFNMDMHVHDEFVIAAYFTGEKAYTCKDEAGLVGRGDLLVIGPKTPHAAHSHADRGCSYKALYPTLEQITDATGLETKCVESRLSGTRLFQADQSGRALCADLIMLLDEKNSRSLKFATSIFFSSLLARSVDCGTPCQTVSARIRKIWDRLYEEPLSHVSLAELAESAQMSNEHLCRTFKASFGISPFQLIRARRTAYARNLIQNGETLSKAALDAGFSDQSHMSRWFRRIYGGTPKNMIQYQ